MAEYEELSWAATNASSAAFRRLSSDPDYNVSFLQK